MVKKKILLINGHPDKKSFCFGIAEAYKKGVLNSNAIFEEIHIRDLEFNPNLEFGYRKRMELEPDLLKAQKLIKWANHIVWVYPVWWGSYPAILKGFIDRVFLPNFAFKKRENSVWWDKYLTGKSARVISTLDQPAWYYRWINNQPSYNSIKKLTCDFVGIKPVKFTTIGSLRNSKDSYRENWLYKIEKLGKLNR
ncbi:NAD(P)H-dependent oxidoreductase [Polaribacter haliotis]|uniref:NAD(P)H-dependent oxidoreductase n=1 Tax=Polaribacter haliotis TaxID=1888915 RepID=A0A7L8AEV5_9FLAO|nr:NAD(P)H-dependent oxidoreductase [Polaribacter haliotis]QOD60369.1 NAD(P)H-dependent oxidoreductase [Polaribacter haliotis]